MGTLRYGNGGDASFVMDDVDLAHLAAVATAKLRRREPFLLTCLSDETRQAIWIHESSTIVYSYDSAAQVELDRKRLEAMVQDTNRPSGLAVRCHARALHAVDALVTAA